MLRGRDGLAGRRLRPLGGLRHFGQIEVLTPEQCTLVADTVLALRPQWTSRSPTGAFATLGVNAYLDLATSADPHRSYFDRVTASNQVLVEHFADTLATLAGGLAGALDLPARCADDLPWPGFHIWTAAGIPRRATASRHFDLQYQRILDQPAYAGATGTVSFTLPVRLPAAGSGLLVWPGVVHPARPAEIATAASVAPCTIDYRVGCAVLHSGLVLHQIGPTSDVVPGDLRITLQGHGLVLDDELVLYW